MNKVVCTSAWLVTLLGFGLTVASNSANAQQADPAAIALIDSLSLRESPQPIRNHPRWAKPRKVVVAYRSTLGGSEAEFLAGIEAVAGDAEVVLFEPFDPDLDLIADADVFIGFCRPQVLKQLENLRWIHTYLVGVDRCLSDPGVRKIDFIMSNNQRVSGPSIAELAITMTLMLSRKLPYYQEQQDQQRWARNAELSTDLSGKTLLILGLGGIGTETARRASALGMRVIATRNSSREGPEFVDKVGLSDEMYEFAGEADFVVNALPLTDKTNGLIDSRFFDALRPGAYYISVGRGKTTVTDDLVVALNDGTLAGAGLDVTDPEPLPSDHPLWVAKNVVITPHIAGRNVDSVQRTLIIARENLRRYVLGEKLLSVVDVERGY
jgi:phosphoglycerate dehydrogenase-like enzyme